MKKQLKGLFALLILLSVVINSTVFGANTDSAKTKETSYKINYIINSESTKDFSAEIKIINNSAEGKITNTRPKKAGYKFIGWSLTGYEDNLLQAYDKITLTDSVDIYAVWRKNKECIVRYYDGENEIYPAHITSNNRMFITEFIPEKEGYVFLGWEDNKGKIRLSGQEIYVGDDTNLKAIWDKNTEAPAKIISITKKNINSFVFKWKTSTNSNDLKLILKNLTNKTEKAIDIKKNETEKSVDSLSYGQYEAYIISSKLPKTLKSNIIRFLVAEHNEEIKCYIDGLEFKNVGLTTIETHVVGPLRTIAESIGCYVEYNGLTNEINVIKGSDIALFKINSNQYIINGVKKHLSLPVECIEDICYIPVFNLLDIFGYEIEWDYKTNSVLAYSSYPDNIVENIYYIKNKDKYLSYDGEKLCLTDSKDDNSLWIISIIDKENNFYEIYNFNELYKPLEVTASVYEEKQSLRIWENTSFDGYLWKIEKTAENKYVFSPAADSKFTFNVQELCIDTQANTLELEPCRF